MKLGMIGLGRMGANMAHCLMCGGHQLVGVDPKPVARKDLENEGAESADSLATLIAKLPAPRTLWLMVPRRRNHGRHPHESDAAAGRHAQRVRRARDQEGMSAKDTQSYSGPGCARWIGAAAAQALRQIEGT